MWGVARVALLTTRAPLTHTQAYTRRGAATCPPASTGRMPTHSTRASAETLSATLLTCRHAANSPEAFLAPATNLRVFRAAQLPTQPKLTRTTQRPQAQAAAQQIVTSRGCRTPPPPSTLPKTTITTREAPEPKESLLIKITMTCQRTKKFPSLPQCQQAAPVA